MAAVTFYEKPGCKSNLRQKRLLAAAGHTVQAKNLSTEAWSADRLLAFLGKLEIGEWFNRSAPLVKSGEIVPDNLGFEQALHLLLENPLLIRRPLMEIVKGTTTQRCVGFDPVVVDAWIGLNHAGISVGELEPWESSARDSDGCNSGIIATHEASEGDGAEEANHGRCGAH